MSIHENAESGTAVVLGAGTMGGGIAADLANAGWTVHLLDTDADSAAAGKARLLARRPPLLFLPEMAGRIYPHGIADDDVPSLLAAADWVVEAVAEEMGAKRDILALAQTHCGPETIVTSNTSGLSLAAMSADCPPDFRRRFFGTHFLNPPRYLKLLEVIPTPDTDRAVLGNFVRFAERVLGHRVVIARDTPGFISTRLWITHLLDTIHAAEERQIPVETVDALTGTLLGRPKSATCRMADIVGLDIVAAIAANQYAALPGDPLRHRLQPLPRSLEHLLAAGHTGEKAGAGFYRRDGNAILAFDPTTGDYRPQNTHETSPPILDELACLPLAERFAYLAQNPAKTPEADFLNAILETLTGYVAAIGPEIAGDALSIDRAMQWGFGWEIGPLRIADSRGESNAPYFTGTPPRQQFRVFGLKEAEMRPFPDEPEYINLAAFKAGVGLVADSPEASLADLGDGVFRVEFRTKMNTFRPALHEFLRQSLEQAARRGRALVIGNQSPHFCAGYDLTRLADAIEKRDWARIDSEMRLGQETFRAVKYAPVPVVAAVHGFTLGAGCECALHCHRIQAASETRFGLPEMAVGLLPCHGGTREVLIRELEAAPHGDLLAAARAALRRLVFGQTTGNAREARSDKARFLRPTDHISHNPDRLLFDAKQAAIRLLSDGYAPATPADIPVTGADGLTVLRSDIAAWREADTLTDHDAVIADRMAVALCGGKNTVPGDVSETALLDVERAAFLDLCREPLTQARIVHLLKTGKPLKN